MSDNADDTDGVTIANKRDSNFFEVTPGSGIYKTAPFYLHYTAKVDLSKDIGFKMYRDLELEKIAADDETIKQ